MIVLKDIKVSKTRIPVQNALWLRPVDKETYKIYYPSGGNWKEIIFEATEGMDNTFEERVKALENSLKQVNVDISGIKQSLRDFNMGISRENTSIRVAITSLNRRVTALESITDTIIKLMGSQITSFTIEGEFYEAARSGREYSREEMYGFGFSELVFRNIYSGKCKKALYNGDQYDIVFPEIEEANADSSAIPLDTPFFLVGPDITDAEDISNTYHVQYTITTIGYETSVDQELRYIYTIEYAEISGEEPDVPEEPIEPEVPIETEAAPILIGTLKTDSTIEAWCYDDETIEIGVHVYSSNSMSSPATSGSYLNALPSVFPDLQEFEVGNGVILSTQMEDPDPAEVEPYPEEPDPEPAEHNPEEPDSELEEEE